MAEFKIGEVNNYFSQDDANSIFKANIDDNVTEDQRDKKRVEIIAEAVSYTHLRAHET